MQDSENLYKDCHEIIVRIWNFYFIWTISCFCWLAFYVSVDGVWKRSHTNIVYMINNKYPVMIVIDVVMRMT